jgi:hypothetical protein
MHREGFRHLPVMKDGKVVGIVSARSALDPELEEFASETSRRRHFDSMRCQRAGAQTAVSPAMLGTMGIPWHSPEVMQTWTRSRTTSRT